jgi:hypothetical protein
MALCLECMHWCARKLLDTADIVRDGDFSLVDQRPRSFRVADHSLGIAEPAALWGVS